MTAGHQGFWKIHVLYVQLPLDLIGEHQGHDWEDTINNNRKEHPKFQPNSRCGWLIQQVLWKKSERVVKWWKIRELTHSTRRIHCQLRGKAASFGNRLEKTYSRVVSNMNSVSIGVCTRTDYTCCHRRVSREL